MRVLVTGASSGIGRAVCERLLASGHRAIGIARNLGKFPCDHARYQAHAMDLAALDALPERLKALAAVHPQLDALVLNAGVGRFGALEQFSFDQIRALIDLNFTSQVFVARAFLPTLKKAGRGHLVFTGSEAALAGTAQTGPLIVYLKGGHRMADIKRFAVCMVCGRSCIVSGQGKPVCGEEHRQLHTRAVGTLSKWRSRLRRAESELARLEGAGDSAAVLQAEYRVLNLRHRIELWPRPYWQPGARFRGRGRMDGKRLEWAWIWSAFWSYLAITDIRRIVRFRGILGKIVAQGDVGRCPTSGYGWVSVGGRGR